MVQGTATLSNYLWVRSSDVKGTPEQFAPDWNYEIKLLKTPDGQLQQQQIAFLREQAEAEGLDPDEVIESLSDDDTLKIYSWTKKGDYWALCAGNLAKVRRLVKSLGLTLKDERVRVPWEPEIAERLNVVMPPRDYQPEPIGNWIAANGGIIEAAPAFGKTYAMLTAIAARKQYTLVLAHTDILVEQFITRFRDGSPQDDGSFIPITNCKAVEEELGIKIVGRFTNANKIYPVTVSTWQAFSSQHGQQALKALKRRFGFVLIDEAHVFAAPSPGRIISAFHAHVKGGATATPERKDKLEVALYDFVGPVTAKGMVPQLPVVATLIATGCHYKGSRYPRRNEWIQIQNHLLEDPSRNDLIHTYLKLDVSMDRRILVLCNRRDWCVDLAKELRSMGIRAKSVLGGLRNKKTREERADVIRSMMEGEIDVIVATNTFIAGVDIPVLDTLYLPLPQNNKGQLEQALGRIRRKYEDKDKVLLRYFVDEGHGLIYGCARGTHKALVGFDAEIIVVEEGRDPERVVRGGPLAELAATPKQPQSALRRAASKRPDAMTNLFSDPEKARKESNRYKKRLEKKPKQEE